MLYLFRERTLMLFDCLIVPDYGVDKYDIGTGFGHFGIAVEDVSSYYSVFPTFVLLYQIDFSISLLLCFILLATHHKKDKSIKLF